jgi:hypothetical protein
MATKTSHAAAHAAAPRTSHAASVGQRPAPTPAPAQGEEGPASFINAETGAERGV